MAPEKPSGGARRGSAGAKTRRLAAAAAALVVIAAAFFIFRPRPVQVSRESGLNVLLMTLDTTRADRLGCYGDAQAKTPNLDALARNGVLFANAYCQVPLTLPSHCSLLTGTLPIFHGVHNNGTYTLGPENVTLAEVLKDQGFQTAAFVSSFSVDSRFGVSQGFDLYDDSFSADIPFKPLNSERRAEDVYKIFSSWLDRTGKEPFFAWVHFFDPHLPYSPPSPYLEEFKDRLYDGEIAYMDFMVGAVMRKLREKNLLGRTLVVVAGDHGEALGEKGEAGHGIFLYEMSMRVPLLFYAEGRLPAGLEVESRVRLIDILPTILDLLNCAIPASAQGRSLLPFVQKKRNQDLDSYIETVYPRENYGWSPLVGLIAGRWKYIRAPREELYDLKADPAEARNLLTQNSRQAASLKTRLEGLLKSLSGPQAAGPRALTSEEEARLRSLGYVNYSEKSAVGEAPDPKDKLPELKMIQDAERFEFEGDYEAAANLHERLLSLHPGSVAEYVNLALAQARLKKFDQALETLKRGIERIPNSEILLSRLGYTYLVTDRQAEALATMGEVLKINPGNLEALIASAVILDSRGSKEDARGFFERALAIEPENKFLRTSYASNLMTSGRMAEAIDVYGKLVSDYPQDANLYQHLGIAYGISGDYERAIQVFKESTYINPTPAAYYNLALSCRQVGDIQEAVRYMERYLENPRGEPEAKIQAARAELDRLKTLR